MPTLLDLALPWQFSPTVLLATALAVTLYLRGMTGTEPAITHARRAAYFIGVGSIYLALQTACVYYASHMFFVLQLQQSSCTIWDLRFSPRRRRAPLSGAGCRSGPARTCR